MNTLSKISIAALSMAPLLAAAQGNPAYIEKSKIVGSGNVVRLYGLPGKNTAGVMQYWDTTITVEIDANGKPTGNSATTSVRQSKAKSTEFVPGVYVGVNYTCELDNSPFVGRTQFDLRCNNNDFVVTWYTGAINGHPWEIELEAAKLDTIVGAQEFSWGKTVFDGSSTYYGCFNDPELISARQVGNTLTLVNYGSDTTVECQATFTRQP